MSRGATSRGIDYQPALDGLRAVSVIAVLLFHGAVAGFGGGYLGVSVFFTLSGFLISSLMIAERDRTGRVAIGAFYVRRAKRLLPASLLCVVLIAAVASVTDWFDGVSTLRRDLVGAVLQVANWVFLAGSGSYQELLDRTAGQASPVEHYWSLAIEEQFYWVFPLAFIGLWRVGSTRHITTVVVGAVTALAAVSAPVIAQIWGADAAYWSTPARAAEILAGVFAAFVVHGREVPRRWALAAPVALVVLVVAVVTFPSDGGPAYGGTLPLVGAVSALLIVGLQVPGPVRAALSVAPLVSLGRISYGVYLFHWPVYVVLDRGRTGLGTAPLLGVRLAATLAIAIISFVVVERPVRTLVRWRPAGTGVLALGVTAVVVAAIVVVVEPGRGDYWRDSRLAEAAAIDETDGSLAPLVASTVASTTAAPPAPAPSTTSIESLVEPAASLGPPSTAAPLPELARPVRIVVAGDSTAEATGSGLAAWAVANPSLAQVSVVAARGCGLLRGGELDAGGWSAWSERCAAYLDVDLPSATADLRPDVVMVMTTSWDVLDRRWSAGTVLTPLDAPYRQRVATDFAALADRLLGSGAGHVMFVREPVPVPLWGFGGAQAQSDPARHDVIGDVMDEVAAARAGRVSVIDLAGWLDRVGLTTDQDARPDGVHWAPDVARRIADELLGEALLRAALGR